MNFYREYKGAIWTNHALNRLSDRGLTQDIAASAFQHPDTSKPGQNNGSQVYQKYYGRSLVSVVAKKNERGEWLILSCWAEPPITTSGGTRQQEGQEGSFLKKVLHAFSKQLGF
ncbi:MAG: hypothetical protein HY430_02110 [Candidatus Levybacteria bacterium]|nr:hypothetical protein [Candidatus Levybacteria bacterium]